MNMIKVEDVIDREGLESILNQYPTIMSALLEISHETLNDESQLTKWYENAIRLPLVQLLMQYVDHRQKGGESMAFNSKQSKTLRKMEMLINLREHDEILDGAIHDTVVQERNSMIKVFTQGLYNEIEHLNTADKLFFLSTSSKSAIPKVKHAVSNYIEEKNNRIIAKSLIEIDYIPAKMNANSEKLFTYLMSKYKKPNKPVKYAVIFKYLAEEVDKEIYTFSHTNISYNEYIKPLGIKVSNFKIGHKTWSAAVEELSHYEEIFTNKTVLGNK